MAGRPLIYETPEELQRDVDAYFKDNDRVTLAGLALHLGFDSRQTLYNYGERDGFLDIIKKARLKVEAHYEERIIYDSQPTGGIFALKNMGWSDKLEASQDTESIDRLIDAISSIKSDRDEYREPDA